MGGTGSEELTPLACSVTRARCSALFTDATLVSSSSATSLAFQRRTSQRIRTARWRGGRCCRAATNASRMVSRDAATSAGSPSRPPSPSGAGWTQVASGRVFRFDSTGSWARPPADVSSLLLGEPVLDCQSGRCRVPVGGRRQTGDVLRDTPGVPADAGKNVGGDRVEEDQPHEAQPGLPSRDAPIMDRLSVLPEDRKVDPGEVVAETRAPDHVRRVEHTLVLEHGQALTDAGDLRHTLDSGSDEGVRLDPDQGRGAEGELRADLAADRRAHREHVVPEEAEDGEHDLATAASMRNGDLADVSPGEPGGARTGQLVRDLRAGVAGADDEHAAFPQLHGVAVLARVQLDDSRIELRCEGRHMGPA